MQEKVNAYLENLIEGNGSLYDAMRYSLNAGGKRIRPVLAMMTAEALGGKAEDALCYGAALEMIHTYSLIHDDLPAMDNDDLRRGKPTCHKKFGEAEAILAGDALLTDAFSLVANCGLSEKQNLEAVKVLSEAAGSKGMVLGQALDMDLENDSVEKVLFMYKNKTGALLKAAVRLGAIAAGQDKTVLDNFADLIGAAFQIRDDILDIESTTEVLGKPVGSDNKNEKNTIVELIGIQKAKEMVATLTNDAFNEIKKLGEKGNALSELALKLSERTF